MATVEGMGEKMTNWTRSDEADYLGDRNAIRAIRARGEEPSAWLLDEYRELSARRRAYRKAQRG